jgi:subtilisin family serine protease
MQSSAVLEQLLVQKPLAHLRLPDARDSLKPVREVRVAILSAGLDPQLAAHPVFAERVDAPVYVHGASEHGPLMAAHLGLVAALAPTARVLPIGVFDSYGRGQIADVVEGLDRALRCEPDIVYLDFATPALQPDRGTPSPDQVLLGALLRGPRATRALFLAAAGNENADAPSWPAAEAAVLGVAATRAPDELAEFSSRGVELAAPGVDLLSLAGTVDDQLQLEERSGTSLAAGVTTAVAALAFSAEASVDGVGLRALLVQTGRPLPAHSSIAALDVPALAAAILAWGDGIE